MGQTKKQKSAASFWVDVRKAASRFRLALPSIRIGRTAHTLHGEALALVGAIVVPVVARVLVPTIEGSAV